VFGVKSTHKDNDVRSIYKTSRLLLRVDAWIATRIYYMIIKTGFTSEAMIGCGLSAGASPSCWPISAVTPLAMLALRASCAALA